MIACGLDVSKRVAAVLAQAGAPRPAHVWSGAWKYPDSELGRWAQDSALAWVRGELWDELAPAIDEANLVVVESPWLLPTHAARRKDPRWITILAAMLIELAGLCGLQGARVTQVSPQLLSSATGCPKKSRPVVAHEVCIGLDLSQFAKGLQGDVADAAFLAYWGCTRVGAASLRGGGEA
ncbi:MAG: hypothetical protein GF320_11360 [Armatimonadia bacterium]|nr:hypothetical protein [Armatimonadia bacterium]